MQGGDIGQGDIWTRAKVTGVILAALAIIFDGLDNQALGLAVASIANEWSVSPSAFAPVAFIGLVGMTIGTVIAGTLGDRFGRRTMMIASVTVFGLFTLSTTLVTGLNQLMLVQFLAGLGLGGAMPNATALAAEFSPRRLRPMTVTATIVCVPLGGLLAGLVSAAVQPLYGWRAMFIVAGAAPLVLGVALWLWLPESPSFLNAAKGNNDPAEAAPAVKPGYSELFGAGLARNTAGAWTSFFLCLIAVYATFSWLPATLSGAGFDQRTASLGLASFNFGGVAGALLAAMVITRAGSRRVMPVLAAIGAAVAGAVLLADAGQLSSQIMLVALAALGFTINGVQTTLFALASHIYPARIRATGVGAALGFGRVGAMVSSLAGAFILGSGSTFGFFAILALAMAGTTFALLTITNHIPPDRRKGSD